MVDRKTLIVGAAMAVLHQYELGEIAVARARGQFDPEHAQYKDMKHVLECIQGGIVPAPSRVDPLWKDALAHLRQSMRVDYDEWFKVFPWLEENEQLNFS